MSGEKSEPKPGAYNAAEVQKAINKDKRIKPAEANAIHSLLKGRHDADYQFMKDKRDQGAAAQKAGKTRHANPYKEGSNAASEWAKGFNKAQDDSSRKDAAPIDMKSALDSMVEQVNSLGKEAKKVVQRVDAGVREVTKAWLQREIRNGNYEVIWDVTRTGYVELRKIDSNRQVQMLIKDWKEGDQL